MTTPVSDEQRSQILAAIRDGTHPSVACVAAGLSTSYYKVLRHRALHGDQTATEFNDAINAAVAQGEVADVTSTAKAARTEGIGVQCPHCQREYVADPEELAAIIGHAEAGQRLKKMAAEIALGRLERRHPKRWSVKVTHTIEEQHEQLLNIAQRVLPPEMFELLLSEYVAAVDGDEPEAPDTPSSGVH